MAVKAKQRVNPVDIVKFDFEFCDVTRKSQSTTNALSEPVFTTATIESDLKCAIDPLAGGMPMNMSPMMKAILPQGDNETSLYLLYTNSRADIEPGDTVVDADAKEYAVRNVLDHASHKSALLQLDE